MKPPSGMTWFWNARGDFHILSLGLKIPEFPFPYLVSRLHGEYHSFSFYWIYLYLFIYLIVVLKRKFDRGWYNAKIFLLIVISPFPSPSPSVYHNYSFIFLILLCLHSFFLFINPHSLLFFLPSTFSSVSVLLVYTYNPCKSPGTMAGLAKS